MSWNSRRIEKVEASLSPRQAAVLWMQEAHVFGSLVDYVLSLKDEAGAYPMPHLAHQVEKAVRDAMRGEPRDAVTKAVWTATKDVWFLFKLHQKANCTVLEEYRVQVILVGFLAVTRPEPSAPRAERHNWSALAKTVFLQVCGLREAVAIIGARYFDSRDILFPDARYDLDDLIDGLSYLLELYNQHLPRTGSATGKRSNAGRRPKDAINLQVLLDTAHEGGEDGAAKLITFAKIETLRAMGDWRAANAFMDERLWAYMEDEPI